MTSSLLRGLKTKRLPTMVAAFVCAAAAWAVSAHLSSAPRMSDVPQAAQDEAPVALQTATQGERLRAELITLRPTGFEPTEITRPAGQFLIAVDNRTGLEEVTLQLDREAGGRLHAVQMPRVKKLRWRQMLDLGPGSYVLTEANHPEWVCRITVTQ